MDEDRRFDQVDAAFGRLNDFLVGMLAGVLLLAVLLVCS